LRFQFSAAAAACAGTVATKFSSVILKQWYGDGVQSAVCAEHPMVAGAHYVEMTLVEKSSNSAYMGVVGQGFDAAGRGGARMSAEGWMLDPFEFSTVLSSTPRHLTTSWRAQVRTRSSAAVFCAARNAVFGSVKRGTAAAQGCLLKLLSASAAFVLQPCP
jgi:hypothetical protein